MASAELKAPRIPILEVSWMLKKALLDGKPRQRRLPSEDLVRYIEVP